METEPETRDGTGRGETGQGEARQDRERRDGTGRGEKGKGKLTGKDSEKNEGKVERERGWEGEIQRGMQVEMQRVVTQKGDKEEESSRVSKLSESKTKIKKNSP
jgi:hypothetical protein